MEQLNEKPEISSLQLLTYSKLLNNIDHLKEKNIKSTFTFFDLKKLVQNFTLDISLDKAGYPGYTKTPSLPAFISKSFYQKGFAYNFPPKGPIPQHFECMFCDQEGPAFHAVECEKPFESSLYLTESGVEKYKKPAGTSYKLIVKKRGQKKVISTNVKNQKFSDNVELYYENENKSQTILKIGKNGVINIISANFENKSIIQDLLKKINQTGALTSEYPSSTFKVDPSTSYIYIILSQFNLYPKENTSLFINLDAVNLNLWETPLFKQKVSGNTFFKIGPKKYKIENYRYNPGTLTSKSNKQTNPFIQFDIIMDIFKVGVLIYKKGAVQMRLSYLDKKFSQKVEHPLEPSTLQEVYTFLKKVFEILISSSSETNYPIIVSEKEKEKKGILNMVDGKQPKLCQNRKGHELRPVPYSFYGTCPMHGYYVRPTGLKRPDGKYEPCCYSIKKTGKDSQDYINELYRNGFSEGIPDPDTLSAVFTPGTKIVESRRFKGLNDLTEKQLLDAMERLGYIGKESPFKKGNGNILFEYPSYITSKDSLENSLMISIPNDTVRANLVFDESGKSYFINTSKDTAESRISSVPILAGTTLDGYLDIEEFVFYPFDIPFYKGENITKQPFKKRFDILMYCLEILHTISGSLTFSTNFDDSIENLIDEEDSFILFIPLKSNYTIGKINKELKIWTSIIPDTFLTFNVHPFRGNRWKISIHSKSISSLLLPQKEDSIEMPVVFTTKNAIEDNDVVLFKLNLNQNGTIHNNKPLIPIQKVNESINDYTDVKNILEYIKSPITKESLIKV
jgi:hypothetical protein